MEREGASLGELKRWSGRLLIARADRHPVLGASNHRFRNPAGRRRLFPNSRLALNYFLAYLNHGDAPTGYLRAPFAGQGIPFGRSPCNGIKGEAPPHIGARNMIH